VRCDDRELDQPRRERHLAPQRHHLLHQLTDPSQPTGLDHSTRPRQALGASFTINCDDAALAAYLDDAFGDLPEGPGPALAVEVRTTTEELTVRAEDRTYYRGDDPGVALANLASAVNTEAVRASDHLVLVHAGGVERDGRAALFPARPAAGKSTLVAGLVQRGFGALTDEVVALDPATGHVVPYSRPIGLKRGSWSLLPTLRPTVSPAGERYLTEQWLVAPSAIRPGGAGGPSRPAFVVIPRYEPDTTTSCRAISRAQGLRALAESSHNLAHWGRRGFDVLAEVARGTTCHELTSGSLPTACDAVEALFSDVAT
jgi:hypothetical protein